MKKTLYITLQRRLEVVTRFDGPRVQFYARRQRYFIYDRWHNYSGPGHHTLESAIRKAHKLDNYIEKV